MIVARVVGEVVASVGPGLEPSERLWVCARLDRDLLPTGRVLVGVGDRGLGVGALVFLRDHEPDGRPFDLRVEGPVDDLGMVGPGDARGARRYWLR